jgi:epsilon-lactone hydrolase
MRRMVVSGLAVALISASGLAQERTNSSTIAPDGTAYVTRVVPVPKTVSPEAQAMLGRVVSDANVPSTLEQRRARAKCRRSYIRRM